MELTAKEFDLLELFIRNPRQVLTRDLIYDRIWNYDFGGESNIIEVYIRYLRSKLEVTVSRGCCIPCAGSAMCCVSRNSTNARPLRQIFTGITWR